MALRTIRLFISSPGDVAEERLIARRLIGRLDAQFGGLLHFEAVLWERSPLLATASFQEQLIKPSDTDVVIVILWSRLGTALPSHIVRADGSTYASGTEFEFEDAIGAFKRDGKPHILTYLKTAPITPSGKADVLEEAARQTRALDRFVATWFRNAADGTLKGAFHNFAAPADFEDLLEAHLTRLADQFVPAGVAVRTSAPTWRGRSPFRGLQVFEPEHAPVFFGRTAATATMLSKLRAQGQAGRAFVLIVSMSGSGKSSLIRAGVLPLLLQPGVVGSATSWRHAVLRPADGQGKLVDLLQQTMLRATRDDAIVDEPSSEAWSADRLVSTIGERLAHLAKSVTSSDDGTPAACHVALVIDQLEEVFSDERVTPAERDAFFVAVDALARSGFVWILTTMRSDSYVRIAESPTLVALKEGEGQFDLLPPNLREIGQIIRLPAAAAGLRFETRPNTAEKLDDVIRDASARNPGALPLLQFLLEELYQRRNDEDVLTFRAYEELGGVEGALAQQADKVLASASDEARAALSTVLRELVTFGADDESRALRRVAQRSAFVTSGANELVDALLEARLLVSGSGGDGTAVVSLAHEALLEFWPRMKAWVEEDRELLVVHARLETATREWERNARSADFLLPRGKPLAEARELAGAGIRLSEPESALLASSKRRAKRFAIIRASAVAGLAVLTIIAGIAAFRARVESGRAQVQATTAQRTTDFMVGLFADADPDQSRGDKVTVREVLDRGVMQIDSELRDESAVRSNLLRAMGQAYNGLGLFQKARSVLEQAVVQSKNSGSIDALLKAQDALGNSLFDDGNYVEAERLFRDSLALAEQSYGPRSDAAAVANEGIANSLWKLDKTEEAESRFRQALAVHLALHGEDSLETATDLDGLGALFVEEGRYAEAEPPFVASLNIRKKLFGARHGKVSWALNNLGILYFQTGRYDLAERMWTEALPIDRAVYGDDHALTAATLNNLGRVELLTNHLSEANVHMSEALQIWRKSLTPGHDDFVPTLNSLAMILIAQNDLDGARPLLAEALVIASKRQHPFLDQVLGNQAELEVREGRLAEAETKLTEARKVLSTKYGAVLATTESWRTAILDVTQAGIDIRAGHTSEADRLLSNAFTVLSARFGTDNIYLTRIARVRRQMSA